MINAIKKFFSSGPSVEFVDLIERGAQIIDVRTKGEYQSGHLNGSINIPLNELQLKLNTIKKDVPVITCCASGMRSASAKNILDANGFKETYNGGGWKSLKQKVGL